jgi:hypothetical protein
LLDEHGPDTHRSPTGTEPDALPRQALRVSSSSLLRLIGASIAGLAVLGVGLTPAEAHPFGPPQSVTISVASPADAASDANAADAEPTEATGPVVTVRWSPGAVDDLALLWQHLRDGAVDQTALNDPTSVSLGDAAAAAREMRADPRLESYLKTNIAVSTDAGPCAAALRPIASLPRDGATLEFSCTAGASDAEVRVSTLTDLHPAYRIFATGPGGAKAVYDIDHVVRRWSLDGDGPTSASLGRSAVLQLSLTGAGLLGITILTVGALRRRTRKDALA